MYVEVVAFNTQTKILLLLLYSVNCHIVGDKTQMAELKRLCEHAYTCFHDTVIICGKSVNEARTFLDLCDLYEYSCEYNMGGKQAYGPPDDKLPQSMDTCNTRGITRALPTLTLHTFAEEPHVVINWENLVFRHVKEDEICPNPKALG